MGIGGIYLCGPTHQSVSHGCYGICEACPQTQLITWTKNLQIPALIQNFADTLHNADRGRVGDTDVQALLGVAKHPLS